MKLTCPPHRGTRRGTKAGNERIQVIALFPNAFEVAEDVLVYFENGYASCEKHTLRIGKTRNQRRYCEGKVNPTQNKTGIFTRTALQHFFSVSDTRMGVAVGQAGSFTPPQGSYQRKNAPLTVAL